MTGGNRGVALTLVLWGLVVGGALLTLVTLLAVQEQRSALALRQEERGLVGAERVAAELIAGLTVGKLDTRLPRALDSLSLDAGSEWNALVRRLTADVFLLEVAPRGPGVPLGWLLRASPDSFLPVAAVSVGGPVVLGDGVSISGVDVPPAWGDSCPAPDSAIAGIAAESIVVTGSAALGGSPPQLVRPVPDQAEFDRLWGRASLSLPGGTYSPAPATVGTACDLQTLTNWGDPGGSSLPCGDYLTVVRISGDVTLDGGVGQGILLVNGDLHITSGFTFHGIILVTGAVDVTAQTDVRGILAAGELRSGAGPVTQLKVNYSKCLTSKALEISSPLSPLATRAWNQLFRAP